MIDLKVVAHLPEPEELKDLPGQMRVVEYAKIGLAIPMQNGHGETNLHDMGFRRLYFVAGRGEEDGVNVVYATRDQNVFNGRESVDCRGIPLVEILEYETIAKVERPSRRPVLKRHTRNR
jgi:hypothetical protein